MVTRRDILLGTAGIAAIAAAGVGVLKWRGSEATAATEGRFEVTKTPEEWRKILTPQQYAVLREEDTEAPWTAPSTRRSATAPSPARAASCRCSPRRRNS